MTVSELRAILATLPDSHIVVLDVNSEQCDSDRNVLNISEVITENIEHEDDTPRWITFICAGAPLA